MTPAGFKLLSQYSSTHHYLNSIWKRYPELKRPVAVFKTDGGKMNLLKIGLPN